MVNRENMIMGRHVDRHPLSGQDGGLGVYVKDASVLAAQAMISGIVETPEGQMTFQPGDWIVTDNPPTHAWPVRDQVFRDTYRLAAKVDPGSMPVSEPYVLEEPDVSVPPHDTVDRKRAEMGQTDDVPRRGIATSESLGMAEKKAKG